MPNISVREKKISHLEDYTSDNTERLNIEQIKQLIVEIRLYQGRTQCLRS